MWRYIAVGLTFLNLVACATETQQPVNFISTSHGCAKHQETEINSQFPYELEFEHKSADKVNAQLTGIHVPTKIDTRNPDMPSAKSTFFTPEYYVATYDLNSDGNDEIFLYTAGIGLCGSAGCELKVYQSTDDGSFRNIINNANAGVRTPQSLLVFEEKTQGYHNIGLSHSAVWKWNGAYYKFSHVLK